MNSLEENDIEESEADSYNWIAVGYFFALLGGLVGIFVGWHLWTSKTLQEDGTKAYTYRAQDRNHGIGILVLGLTSMLIWLYLNFVYFKAH